MNAAAIDSAADLTLPELMAMDLVDCGWDPDAIEAAMGQEAGWLAAAMEKAAQDAQRSGLH